MPDQVRPLSYENLSHLLAPRARQSHKGSNGHVLVIGGAPGFGGAALLAAEAAIRTGAGLCSVATHPEHAAHFLIRRPELMCRGALDASVINALGERASTLVLGPGLGQSAWSRSLWDAALLLAEHRDLPVILDADGLNILAELHSSSSVPKCKWILTPHPGEAARLLGCSVADINADRHGAVRQLQQRFGGVAVLKGAGTLVCTSRHSRQLTQTCIHGNPGMGSGGMGDVLSGIISGLVAQGFGLENSARLGVCIHSKAADLVATAGERGLLATDLFEPLRTLLNP